MNIEDFDGIKSVHIETLRNDRYHLRLGIRDEQIMENLKSECELNSDGKSYTLRANINSYLIMTPDQTDEIFEIEHNSNQDRVLKIRKMPKQHMLDMMNKLKLYGSKELEYISINRTHAFVGFKSRNEAATIMHKFIREGYEVALAESQLKVKKRHLHNNYRRTTEKSSKSNMGKKSQKFHPYKKVKKNDESTNKTQQEHQQASTSSNSMAPISTAPNFMTQTMNPIPFIHFPPQPNQLLQNYSVPMMPPFNAQMPGQMLNQSYFPISHFNSFPPSTYPNNYCYNNVNPDYDLVMIPKNRNLHF